MTHALLNLNQSLKPELKPVGLDQLLKGTERILRRVLPTAVPTKFSKHTLMPVIMADVTQPQQVIMNLAADASRAMPVESLLEVQARNGPKYVTIAKRSRASAIYRKMRSGSTYRSRRGIATRRRLAWAGISKSCARTAARSTLRVMRTPSCFECLCLH